MEKKKRRRATQGAMDHRAQVLAAGLQTYKDDCALAIETWRQDPSLVSEAIQRAETDFREATACLGLLSEVEEALLKIRTELRIGSEMRGVSEQGCDGGSSPEGARIDPPAG